MATAAVTPTPGQTASNSHARPTATSAAVFHAYPKMDSSTNKMRLPPKLLQGQWVATEKVHGANFCCILTRVDAAASAASAASAATTAPSSASATPPSHTSVRVEYARRKDILTPEEDFFGYKSVIPAKYEAKLEALGSMIFARYPDAPCAFVYTELFGGHYPHPDVPRANVPGLKLVQREIYYTPTLELYAFDIALPIAAHASAAAQSKLAQAQAKVKAQVKAQENEARGNTEGSSASSVATSTSSAPVASASGEGATFLTYAESLELFKAADLFCAEPLVQGTLEEVNAFSERFRSTIPARLGLPALSQPNLAEGLIVRPLESQGRRNAFKRKIAEFREHGFDAENGYKEAVTKEKKAGRRKGQGVASAEEIAEFEVMACITEARVGSVVSKHGRCELTEPGYAKTILDAFLQDIVEDFPEEEEDQRALAARIVRDSETVRSSAKAIILAYFKGLERAEKEDENGE